MKLVTAHLFIFLVVALSSCNKDSQKAEAGEAIENSNGNDALYDQVMKVHDEVMPKMNDIYKLREDLKNKIATNPTMRKEDLVNAERAISKLDSASESMMVWMREFNPLPDSLAHEPAREYLESEMQKVKSVRETIIQAIDNAEETLKQ
jgi:cell division protein FtsX